MTAMKQSSLRLLVIDDNRTNRIVAERIIFALGQTPSSCESGVEALSLLEKKQFDLILMDIFMPLLNGYETTQELRKMSLHATVPIIAFSDQANYGYRQKCLNAGMNGFLNKPLKAIELEIILQKFCAQEQNGASPVFRIESDLKVLNQEILENIDSLDNSNGALLKDVVGLFINNTPPVLNTLYEVMESGNREESVRLASKIKGMCANIGALRLIHGMEYIGLSYSTIPAQDRQVLSTLIDREFEATVSALKTVLAGRKNCSQAA